MPRTYFACLLGFSLSLAVLGPARAEHAPWDQAKVSELATQLAEASKSLYDTFYKQPPPQAGSGQGNDYRRLKQQVRRIQTEARELAGALGKGEGREDTHDIYENLMSLVRDARQSAQRVFSTQDVQDKASKARQLINQLTPYYDPDAQPLQPASR
jgi:hypothetical protein